MHKIKDIIKSVHGKPNFITVDPVRLGHDRVGWGAVGWHNKPPALVLQKHTILFAKNPCNGVYVEIND